MSINNVESYLKESHASSIKKKWSDRVLSIENDGIWISGMNQNCGRVARQIRQELENCGYSTTDPRDEHGGLFVGISPKD